MTRQELEPSEQGYCVYLDPADVSDGLDVVESDGLPSEWHVLQTQLEDLPRQQQLVPRRKLGWTRTIGLSQAHVCEGRLGILYARQNIWNRVQHFAK